MQRRANAGGLRHIADVGVALCKALPDPVLHAFLWYDFLEICRSIIISFGSI